MPTSGRCARHRGELLAGERARQRRDARVRRKVAAAVAAQHAEREVRRAGRVRGRHARVRVLLELERRRPAVLDRVAEPVQRADAGVAAPREDELARAAHPDQLVVDDVRRHPDERQVAPLLPDQLVARGVRDQMREALERDGVAVARRGRATASASVTISAMHEAGTGCEPLAATVIQRSSVNSSITAWPPKRP